MDHPLPGWALALILLSVTGVLLAGVFIVFLKYRSINYLSVTGVLLAGVSSSSLNTGLSFCDRHANSLSLRHLPKIQVNYLSAVCDRRAIWYFYINQLYTGVNCLILK